MAALPQTEVSQPRPTLDEAASQLGEAIEGYYDEIGLSESERDERYASAREFLDSKNSAISKP